MCKEKALEFLRAKNEELQTKLKLLVEINDSLKSRSYSYHSLWESCRSREESLENVVRGMLDEIAYEDDTCWTRELRHMLWDDSDTKSRNECEKRGD